MARCSLGTAMEETTESLKRQLLAARENVERQIDGPVRARPYPIFSGPGNRALRGMAGLIRTNGVMIDNDELIAKLTETLRAKEYDIGLESWRAREARALARETGTLVGTAQRANLLYLWSIKQIRPVSESAATDYLIVERWCLLDKPAGAGGSRCSLVGWSTVTVRSLVNPLPING